MPIVCTVYTEFSNFSDCKYNEEIKLLTRKNSKLEEKLNVLQTKASSDKSQRRLLSKATLTEPQSDTGISKEKILLQTEYLRRLNQPAYERVNYNCFSIIFSIRNGFLSI